MPNNNSEHVFLFLYNTNLMSYCSYVAALNNDNVHKHYHDKEYGFPLADDDELFARLVLEINQAGLSWTTILNKKDNFFKAYDNFNVKKVAKYNQKKIDTLLNDAGIIRNRLKINAAIENAKKILEIQKEHGSFKKWLDKNHPLTKEEWVKLFKKHFRFTGGEIVNEFLMSSGYLPGAHAEDCPVYKKIIKLKPMWLK
ncbi:DNA-3-methyladenine glycosylase I [Parafilimonas terrae]|uniref:DNA-3-methyladenine glycosylase I n=2 Tax=Parafilimonas terrae TaxID=1465490 RepID=A0A1I5YYV0_9BACT|nr:DNA-3-methyladenine glycosylase I [Parafilimonas terrae]